MGSPPSMYSPTTTKSQSSLSVKHQPHLWRIRLPRYSKTAEVRFLKFWEAKNVKKGGQLMGADFLLVDEKSTPVTSSLTTPVNVCVSLFDGLAFAFHSKLDSYGSEPKVLVFTSINPQLVGATGIENYEKLIGDGSDQTPSSSKLPHAQKIEPLTISKLNQYVITSEPQTDKGWCYIGCSKCSTKLQREISSFTCLFCDKTNAVAAALMYRVELSVSDLKDDAVFVAFDMEIVTFTSIRASEAAQILLKLGKFNFTSKHQTFTIPRIITEKQRPPLPDFFIHVVVASGVGAEGGEPTSANHQPSSSVVAGLVCFASTIPILTHTRIEKRSPAWHSYSCRSNIPTYYTY
ncbi:unnamed protein product [Brassica oleracea]